ncbi:TPA: hypothetical protein ACHFYZ_000157 [Escherichia coli]|uniref:hypothetical protein n=1 Tax=Escherichia coli TaxID=562 RepID=UPI0010CC9CE4|nr:hypothetical protein [Escherichia coli]EFD5120655.1 hypothetical protein [Escherichia coli]EHD3132872.1 hypothetical protein [Escherichia coli]ELR3085391.1 hypothetical protein [Escherichia coli]GDA60711.1 hypothetical protein HmCmsJML185_01351 [Escherichia coli]
MSSIRSITSKMITTVLHDDFHIGMLTADAAGRNALAKVNVNDVDVLISRLEDIKEYISTIQSERIKEAHRILEMAIKENDNSTFDSVEDLLAALQTDAPVQASTTKQLKPNGNRIFEVVIVDAKNDERRRYNVINKKIPAALLKDTVYQQLIKKNPELADVDEFLRAYSEEYRTTYPINAKWNGKEFHLNTKGKMNSKAKEYYAEYKKEFPKNADEQDFKEYVTKSYKVV